MAKKSLIETTVSDNNAGFTLTVEGAGSIEISVSELPADIQARALIHGLVQKISDAAAMPKADLPDDPTEAAAVKFAAMQSVAQRLIDGDWSKRTGEGSGPVAGLIFRAFYAFVCEAAKAKKKPAPSEAEARAVYNSKDRAGQLALRNVPRIAELMEQLRAAKAPAKSIDADSLLGELGL